MKSNIYHYKNNEVSKNFYLTAFVSYIQSLYDLYVKVNDVYVNESYN